MAEPLMNDVLFSEALNSDGYVVDFALGTTYNLDLEALLSVPISLGMMGELNENFRKSPHYLLEAVRKSADRFIVFNHAGQISVPNHANKVYSLLEQSVVQVNMPNKGNQFFNFHPKIWVIKETCPETQKAQLKVIVMSRNLSYSNNIDVICELTGEIKKCRASEKTREKHTPLRDFIIWLGNKTKGKKKGSILSLCEDLDHVCNGLKCSPAFCLDGSPFEDYDFFPMGIDNYNGKKTCLNKMKDQLQDSIVISPFIDESLLKDFTATKGKGKHTLITRHEYITPQLLELFKDGVYAVKDILTDKDGNTISVDIHEKIYYTHQSTGENFLYLGSTNATQNGFERNIEFLIRLKFSRYKMSYAKLKQEFIYEAKDCPFEQVTEVAENEEKKEDSTEEIQFRNAIASIGSAKVINNEDNTYNIQIVNKPLHLNTTATIYPMYTLSLRKELSESILFEHIKLDDLTEFYVIEVGNIKRLIKIETKDLPYPERDMAIFQNIINTKEKFITYISFMLTDDTEEFMCEMREMEQEKHDKSMKENRPALSLNLYEEMVRLAYTQPERIKEIKEVVEKLSDEVVPDEFRKMYEQFEIAIKKVKRV